MTRRLTKSIAGSVALAVAVSCLSVPASSAAEAPSHNAPVSTITSDHQVSANNQDSHLADEAQEWEEGLDYIMSIPDDVLLQGDAATQEWVRENPASPASQGDQVTPYASVLGCAGAITAMIAGNLVGAAKLLKIKKYIKALGGVKEAVQLMWGASFSYEKMAAAGGALGALAAELTGIAGIQDQCFE